MAVPALIKYIGGLFEPATELLDEIITSKDEKQQNLNKLLELKRDMMNIQAQVVSKLIDFESQIITVKGTSLTAELNGSRLQKGWRPVLMLAFGFIIIYQYFLGPVLDLKTIEFLPDRFWSLLEIGIGGYIAGRSLEKIVPSVSEAVTQGKRMAELEYGKKEALSPIQEAEVIPVEGPEIYSRSDLRRLKRKQRGEERRANRLARKQ